MPRNGPRRKRGGGGGGAKMEKKPSVIFKPPSFRDELCAFFRGTGTDIECRTLEQILNWGDQLMEVCHDYIQWLLPTDENSKFNFDAPILDEECQRIFRSDLDMRRNLRRGAQRFMKFLGLSENLVDRPDTEALRIARAPNFQQRMLMCWKGPANHNWRRISRALRCFGLVGMEEEQQALLACLEEIIVDFPGMIDESTIGHWLNEACVKSKLVHQVTPGYVNALLSSPNLLASLCKQYIGKYDVNLDGRLQFEEVLTLTKELHNSLGLPPAVDESELAASISAIDSTGSLSAEEFPRWFAEVLRSTLAMLGEANREEEGDTESEEEIDLELRPEYVAALIRSPKLLENLCKRYFKKYDTNYNGEIEVNEALRLTLELHDGLGLPVDTVNEEEITTSMAQFACGKDVRSGTLCSADFPAWLTSSLHTVESALRQRRHTA